MVLFSNGSKRQRDIGTVLTAGTSLGSQDAAEGRGGKGAQISNTYNIL